MINLSSLRPRHLGPQLTLLLTVAATAAQAQTLSIQGTGGSSLANDVTAFVDKVEIVRVSDGVVIASALANAGFEASNALGNGDYGYNPTGGSWNFASNTGIETTGSNFGAPTNPEGTRGAFIQNNPNQPSAANAISQALTLTAGTYQVRFLAAQRGCCAGVYDQGLTVSVGGVQVGAVTPASTTSFASYTSKAFAVDANGAVTIPTNNALAFDASDDYVAVAAQAGVSNLYATGYTLEAWVYLNSAGGAVNSIIRKDGDYNLFVRNNGLITTQIWQGNTLYENNAATALVAGRWNHIVGTWNGTSLKSYLNGVEVTGTTNALNLAASSPFWLGRSATFNEPLNGRLDEVRIYNTPLTLAQIQADMFSPTPVVPASLQLYYTFDQGTAGGPNASLTALTDQAGKGNTGTLTNFAGTGAASNWVRSFPTITGLTPTSGNTNTQVALAGTNLLDATGFGFNSVAGTFATPTNDLAATVTVPLGATTGPVSVASAALPQYNGPTFAVTYPDLVISTSGQTIPVTTYNSITVQSGGTGTLAGSVLVNSGVTVQSGGTFYDGCAIIGGAGSFTLAAGGTLGICHPAGIAASGATGAVQTTGARTFSPDASYLYNGTTAQSTGSGLPGLVRNLSTTNANAVTLTAPLRATQVVTVGGAGNLELNGNALTLLSSADGTALVVNAGTGIVSGNTATVQRYIDASGNTGTSGYRHYSAPVSGATVGSLATAGFVPVVNPAYNTAANTGSVTPYPTVYGYDESRTMSTTQGTNLSAFDKGYVSPTTQTDPLKVGQGYAVQIGNAEKVSFTGTLNTGNQTLSNLNRSNQANAGWQLIGNPYPAPLDWGTVGSSQLSGMDAAAYVFQSTGAYTGRYTSFINGLGASTGLIATGQGFFVRTSDISPVRTSTVGSIALTNANRATTYAASPKFQRPATDPRPQVRLSLAVGHQPATPATADDDTFVYFEQDATEDFDGPFDAYKLANPSGYSLATAAQVPIGSPDLGLSINGRAPLTAAAPSDIVPVWLEVPAGTYTLTATALLNFATLNGGTEVYLRDALAGAVINLATTPSYTFGVAANAPTTGRFTLQFGPAATPMATTSAALRQVVATLYPNPTQTADVTLAVTGLPATVRTLEATLTDALGRPVGHYTLPATQGAARTSLPTQGLASGLYLLRLAPRDAQGVVAGTLPTQRLSVR